MLELDDLIEELREAGADEDALCEILDAAIDWRAIVPPPGGQLVEAVDDQAWRVVIRGLRLLGRRIAEWHRDPERRAAARARREARRESRRAKRTERKLARESER